MDRFLRCLCDDDLTALGHGTDEELKEAWLDIASQYYQAKDGALSDVREWILKREVVRLRTHLTLVHSCVDFLQREYNESIATSLRSMGYAFSPSDKDPDKYADKLQAVLNRSNSKQVRLQQVIDELDRMSSESENMRPERKHFEETLLYIEEMQRVQYNMEEVTVAKYVALENKLIKKIEAENQKKRRA